MSSSILLVTVVVSFDIVAYILYNWELVRGQSKPYRATWGVWLFLATLNAGTYFGTTQDVVKVLLATENVAACLVTFVFACVSGRSRPLDPWERRTAVIGVSAAIVWWFTREAFYGNAVMQVCTFVSFVPMFRGVWKDPKSQPVVPWLLWSMIYTANFAVVLLRWEGDWQSLVYPINYIILHAVVFGLTLRGKLGKASFVSSRK